MKATVWVSRSSCHTELHVWQRKLVTAIHVVPAVVHVVPAVVEVTTHPVTGAQR